MGGIEAARASVRGSTANLEHDARRAAAAEHRARAGNAANRAGPAAGAADLARRVAVGAAAEQRQRQSAAEKAEQSGTGRSIAALHLTVMSGPAHNHAKSAAAMYCRGVNLASSGP